MMLMIKQWLKKLFKRFTRGKVSEDEESGLPQLPFTSPAVEADDADTDIKIDYSVNEKWHSGWGRELVEVSEAVIHHTEGNGNIKILRRWMLAGERSPDYKKGISLFHYAIDKNGEIWEAGPVSKWWYHSCSGKHDRKTIGIELIHKNGSYTEEQYASLEKLLFSHIPQYCKSYNRIVSHDFNYYKYSRKKKGCPGPDFDWKRIEEIMNRKGISFKSDNQEEYIITFPG